MGEYAEMEIFAHMRGKSSSDLGINELTEFYGEFDRKEANPPGKFKCSCGRRLKSPKGLFAHRRDKGCKA